MLSPRKATRGRSAAGAAVASLAAVAAAGAAGAAGAGGGARRSASRAHAASSGASTSTHATRCARAARNVSRAHGAGSQRRRKHGIGRRCFHNLSAEKAHAMDPLAAATEASVPSLECRSVTRVLRSGDTWLTVLHEVDLSIAPGEAVAIVGPSGSGKSTLLGLLAGLDRPSGGHVLVEGVALEGL